MVMGLLSVRPRMKILPLMTKPSRPVRKNSVEIAVGVGFPSLNVNASAWKIFSVSSGRAQKPPDKEGESTQISPRIFGLHNKPDFGSTTASVASGMGYPNVPHLTASGIFPAAALASEPI